MEYYLSVFVVLAVILERSSAQSVDNPPPLPEKGDHENTRYIIIMCNTYYNIPNI